jgi:hypothetical protein
MVALCFMVLVHHHFSTLCCLLPLQVTHNAYSTHLVKAAAPVTQGSFHVFEDSLYADMPTINSASVFPFPTEAIVQGATTKLDPQYTEEQGLQKFYANASVWGATTGRMHHMASCCS